MYFYVAEHSTVLTKVEIVLFFPVTAISMYKNLIGQCNEPEAVPLIHTCHAVPLPCSGSAVSFVKVRVVAGNIRTASPTV